MTKPMKIMLICVAIVFGGIFGFKLFQGYMVKRFLASMKQVPTVSTYVVHHTSWSSQLQAAGNLRAIQGVNVTTELAGLVQKIYFTPGALVQAGTLLIQLNADADIAQLHSLEANATLSESVYKRDRAQHAIGAISKATLDADAADVKSKKALVAQQAAIVAKKTIRAPFNGRLGVCQINLGQYIDAGAKIVSLQAVNPIYVDFYLPQQVLGQLKVGQKVSLESNVLPGKLFDGKITTIDPALDPTTRNVEVEATLPNPKELLAPGMFGAVTVTSDTPQQYLTAPQTAISFDSYGNSVYLVKTKPASKKSEAPEYIVEQSFVTTGQTRGDQIVILKGVSDGDQIVSSGQMKIKNHMQVNINNTVEPMNNPAPIVANQ